MRTYRDAEGRDFRVWVDPAYAGSIVERVVSTLTSILHGDEIRRLDVHIGGAQTMARLCGAGSNACYYPDSELMVLAGDPPTNGMTLEMLVAHEYGHHLERNRRINGYPASERGGQHWATYERICEGVRAGRLYPGDEGGHYWENPGEAFAQAYAFMHYPEVVPWWWSFAAPDEGAYEAIRADVVDAGRARRVFLGRLGSRRKRASWAVSAPRDGWIRARFKGAESDRYRLMLRSSTDVAVKRVKVRGRRLTLRYEICGDRSGFTLQLRRSGWQPLDVAVTRP
jgi:hypothetical protein